MSGPEWRRCGAKAKHMLTLRTISGTGGSLGLGHSDSGLQSAGDSSSTLDVLPGVRKRARKCSSCRMTGVYQPGPLPPWRTNAMMGITPTKNDIMPVPVSTSLGG
ncbi:hypothetical protein FRC08_009717, partial [Ceratobasidium sp. 394]